MVDWGHAKETLAVRDFEYADLQDHRHRFGDEKCTHDRQEKVCVGTQCESRKRGTNSERAGIAHKYLGRGRVVPKEADATAQHRHGDHREVERMWNVVDVRVSERPECNEGKPGNCLLYTSPSPRDKRQSRMPSSA